MIAIYVCLLSSLLSSTPMPLQRAVDDVQYVSVLETSSQGSKGKFPIDLSLENLVCKVRFI